MKRTVASLLVRLEHMPPSTVVVAATNQPSMLDRPPGDGSRSGWSSKDRT